MYNAGVDGLQSGLRQNRIYLRRRLRGPLSGDEHKAGRSAQSNRPWGYREIDVVS